MLSSFPSILYYFHFLTFSLPNQYLHYLLIVFSSFTHTLLNILPRLLPNTLPSILQYLSLHRFLPFLPSLPSLHLPPEGRGRLARHLQAVVRITLAWRRPPYANQVAQMALLRPNRWCSGSSHHHRQHHHHLSHLHNHR